MGAGQDEQRARGFANLPHRCRDSFNRRFWYEAGGYLYDVVDGKEGDDPSCRPNQVLAISLRHPVLDAVHWKPALEAVADRLLTPVGRRSLAPGNRTISRATMATDAPATAPIIKAPCGRG